MSSPPRSLRPADMRHRPDHVVLTTINAPTVLQDLADNLGRFGHLDRCRVWVVGDVKTPPECRAICERVARSGLDTVFLDIEQQNAWGSRFPEFYRRLPYNNETRRNVGYLFALEAGCERLISIDDDNFPSADDFLGGHEPVGGRWAGDVLSESSGYHNIAEYLITDPPRRVFPRGFPFALREQINQPTMLAAGGPVIIGANVGLWLQDPDVDAITWLNGAVKATSYRGPERLVLSQSTWTPVNTQNTCVTRDLIPGFLCVPMGFPLPSGKIERYGDIWGGYFLQAVLASTSFHVSVGRPLLEHRRNPHDYLDDLRHEYWGMLLTDWLLEHLRTGYEPASSGVCDSVASLGEFVQALATTRVPDWCPPAVADFLSETGDTLLAWTGVCRKLL